MLLHYEQPTPPHGPATLVQDAMFLDRDRTFESGASLIARYSGRAVALSELRMPTGRRPAALRLNQRHKDKLSPSARSSGSPVRSPARLLSPHKGLESLIQGVSDTLQKRAEGWKVPKVVREAVGEVRRNMNNLPSGTASPRNSFDVQQVPPIEPSEGLPGLENLRRRLSAFEKRNVALAKMIGDALEELRTQKQFLNPNQASATEESFNIALAKIQFVQVYLVDSEIPIPAEPHFATREDGEGQSESQSEIVKTNESEVPVSTEGSRTSAVATQQTDATPDTSSTSSEAVNRSSAGRAELVDAGARPSAYPKETDERSLQQSTGRPQQSRPTLAQSPLSWILGEGQHRSEFVSSSTPPPEQRRDSVPKLRPKHLFPDGKDVEDRNGSNSEGDGFTMSSLRGS